ncbi:hypothetical protein AB0D30_21805 [Streptomyces sp. NPDC048409]|uniref:hypothetical protein n=1 Tax=Streptomyces sp. NPDC048409 TaxID=3154723 RepID=UPI0034355BDB
MLREAAALDDPSAAAEVCLSAARHFARAVTVASMDLDDESAHPRPPVARHDEPPVRQVVPGLRWRWGTPVCSVRACGRCAPLHAAEGRQT